MQNALDEPTGIEVAPTNRQHAWNNGRLLVIGHGFIGSAITAAAIRQKAPFQAITRSRKATDAQRWLHYGNAANLGVLAPLAGESDHVIYCAGNIAMGASNFDPITGYVKLIAPLLSALETCRENPHLSLTFVSSGGTVYGQANSLPIAEDHPTEPISSYGISMLAAEKYVAMYAQLYGIKARIVRCSNAYGPTQDASRLQGVIPIFLDRVRNGLPIQIYGDGSVVRDFVYVDDIAQVTLALLASPGQPALVNVGSGRGTSLLELLSVIESVTGIMASVRHLAARPFDAHANVLDISRLERLIGFTPTPLYEGVRRVWDARSELAQQ